MFHYPGVVTIFCIVGSSSLWLKAPLPLKLTAAKNGRCQATTHPEEDPWMLSGQIAIFHHWFPWNSRGPVSLTFTTIWGPIGRYNLTKYLSILKDLPTSESLTQISQGAVSGKSLGLDPEHMEFDIKKQQLKTTKHNEIESACVRCKPKKTSNI